jgi:hypothetical protein
MKDYNGLSNEINNTEFEEGITVTENLTYISDELDLFVRKDC